MQHVASEQPTSEPEAQRKPRRVYAKAGVTVEGDWLHFHVTFQSKMLLNESAYTTPSYGTL